MNDAARIYRAEILRAVFGSQPAMSRVADMDRLNRIAERLAESERAQSILRAKGHGSAGMSLVDIACSVPNNVRQILKSLFSPVASTKCPDLGDVHDIWNSER